MKKVNKGFTLIELLVVIAIIGILSGIAIFGLSDARKKGQDAAVIAALGQIPAQAAIYYDSNNNYTAADCNSGMFASTENAGKAIDDADSIATTIACFGDTDGFAVGASLMATTSYYCVDGNGFSGYAGSAEAGDGDDDCTQ
jgi:prepilin-type N-terminal cleavage/methylation domain-containing protein